MITLILAATGHKALCKAGIDQEFLFLTEDSVPTREPANWRRADVDTVASSDDKCVSPRPRKL